MGARAYAQVDEATDEETMLKTKGNATHRLPMNSHKNKNRENEYLCLGLLTSDCVLKVIKGKKERKQQWLREKKKGWEFKETRKYGKLYFNFQKNDEIRSSE